MSTEPADHRARLTKGIEACLQPGETSEAVETEIHQLLLAASCLRGQVMENKVALEQLASQSKALAETLEVRIEIERQQSHPTGWQRFLEIVLVILLSASVATCWTHNRHPLPTSEMPYFSIPDELP